MKIIVTGINGQLGYDVCKTLDNLKNVEYLGLNRHTLDITNKQNTENIILNYKPDIIIHCAAYTAVDKAEDEKDLCYNVNVLGTQYISSVAKLINATMIYISTDYVFDGTKSTPYDIDDIPNPINQYGYTKKLGEDIIKQTLEKYFIIRISWVFGINGNNFIKTMLRLGKERKELNIVSDQIGSPTYTADIAKILMDIISTNQYGTYHATNSEYCSWAEFAEFIFKEAKLDVKVNYISTEEYITKAKRPKNSCLDKKSIINIGIKELPYWKDAVYRYIKEINI